VSHLDRPESRTPGSPAAGEPGGSRPGDAEKELQPTPLTPEEVAAIRAASGMLNYETSMYRQSLARLLLAVAERFEASGTSSGTADR